MKTTIDIPDLLLKQVKQLAAERNTTIRAIIESALRDTLAKQDRRRRKFRLDTPTFKGNGLQTGLNWDDWSGIRSMVYEGRGG
jgi:Arc/MetJ family transcription regulator